MLNVFNMLNINPSSISNNIQNSNLGQAIERAGIENRRFPGSLQLLK